MRSLLTQLDIFIEQLNEQTDDIITATESLNALAGQVAAKDETVDKALTTIPQAISVLADSREKLADAIDALGKFSAIATSTGQPDQGIAGRQPAQHRAGASANWPTPGPRSPGVWTSCRPIRG